MKQSTFSLLFVLLGFACLLLIIVGLIAFVGPGLSGTRSTSIPAPTALPPDALAVNLAYASSAQVWFQQVINDFNNTQALSADGKRIVVVGHPMASGAMIETLIKGNSPYEMVAPADKVWMDVRAHGGVTITPNGAR